MFSREYCEIFKKIFFNRTPPVADRAVIINNCLEKRLLPDEMKIVDVSPIFKEDKDLNKETYRPVSI